MAIDPNTGSSVAIGAGSLQSGALQNGAYILTATGNCWVAVGANPTAAAHTAGSAYIPANIPTNVTLMRDQWKFAVIQEGAATGFLSIAQGGD